jgi:hypothetical protein
MQRIQRIEEQQNNPEPHPPGGVLDYFAMSVPVWRAGFG